KLLDFGIVQTAGDAKGDPAKGDPPDRPHVAAISAAATAAPDDAARLTQLGAMLGTPGFMAPEQVLGMPLGGRADLYALACVAWWLLAGREVFPRDGADAKLLHKHLHAELPSLREQVTGWCPPELEAVLAECLAKEPDDRPVHARELAARLRAIPIPAEHAWTDAKARAWWADHHPAHVETAVATSEVQVIMPGRSEQRPLAATLAATSGAALGPTLGPPPRGRSS
ncbi:MAG: hypothetical protein H0X17_25360, partial [Deltaproteobacteria bacterium]|nr:hypothetical protein [Deltaproteobacteria bacterium]